MFFSYEVCKMFKGYAYPHYPLKKKALVTVIEAFIILVHQHLYACVIGVNAKVWSHEVTAVCKSLLLWKHFPVRKRFIEWKR